MRLRWDIHDAALAFGTLALLLCSAASIAWLRVIKRAYGRAASDDLVSIGLGWGYAGLVLSLLIAMLGVFFILGGVNARRRLGRPALPKEPAYVAVAGAISTLVWLSAADVRPVAGTLTIVAATVIIGGARFHTGHQEP